MAPLSSKAALPMPVLLVTLLVLSLPTALSSPSFSAAATIPELIIESCPEFAELLRTGGVMDFASLHYEIKAAAGSSDASQRQHERVLGCTTPNVSDPCGAHRCWLANKTVRGQLYSETRCDRRQLGRPLGQGRSQTGSDVPFRPMQCVESPRQIGYAFVGKCLGANVFRQEGIASKCRLQISA